MNPHNVVHGAVLYAMADTGMGAALYPTLSADKVCATIAQANSGGLVFDNAILYNNGVFGPDGVGNYGNAETQAVIQAKSKVIIETDPMLIDPYHRLTPNYMPGLMSPATRIGVVANPPDDGFFQRVDFIGNPDAVEDPPDDKLLSNPDIHITEKDIHIQLSQVDYWTVLFMVEIVDKDQRFVIIADKPSCYRFIIKQLVGEIVVGPSGCEDADVI